MKKRLISTILILALTASFLLFPNTGSAATVPQEALSISGDYVEGEVLVTLATSKTTTLEKKGTTSFDDDITVEDTSDFGSADVLVSDPTLKDIAADMDLYISHVTSEEYTTEELMDKLQNKSGVISVEPNYTIHLDSKSNDTLADYQWALGTSEKTASTAKGIGADSAWSKAPSGTPVVAVVDTGVNYKHEDLAGSMWVNPYASQGLSGTYGYDYGNNDADPMDTDGHGTHCAGTIAATTGNSLGISGVGVNTKIMALRVFDNNGDANSSNIVSAFNYISNAISYGANVVAINCSWGGSSAPTALKSAATVLTQKGVLFSFAAGNDGSNVETSQVMPYDFGLNSVIAVGASTMEDTAADFSDYGATKVDLFAPGDQILSTYYTDNLVPNLLTSEKRSNLLSYYNTLASQDDITGIYVLNTSRGIVTSVSDATYSASESFMDKGGSASMPVSSSTKYLAVDVTDLGLNPLSTYYISFVSGYTTSSSPISWDHSNMVSTPTATRLITFQGRTYMKIVGFQASSGSTVNAMYVDEVAISKGGVDTSEFGQYEYMGGTSMAAPMVSGALGVLASIYPNDTPTQRKSRLLSCVNVTSALAGKCSTSGILDLTKMETYTAPSLTGLSLTASATKVNVKKSVTITPVYTPTDATGTGVSYSLSTQKYASIDSNGVLTAKTAGAGKTVTVTATSTTNANLTATIKISINKQMVTKVKLNKTKLTLKAGTKKKLKATCTPTYANNKKVKWSTSKKKYATVSSSGVVKVKKAGIGKTVKITAKAKDGSGKKAICRIKIKF